MQLLSLREYPDQYVKLAMLLGRMIGEKPHDLDEAWAPPFFLHSPTRHQSNPDFNVELAAVSGLVANITSVLKIYTEGDDATKIELEALRVEIDDAARRQIEPSIPSNPIEFAVLTSRSASLTATTLIGLVRWHKQLKKRLDELLEEKQLFWAAAHNHAHPHARALALRLAKFYASETGLRPTRKTRERYSEASTSYALALAELFEIMSIPRDTRAPMVWAINRITDDDLLSFEQIIERAMSPIEFEEKQSPDDPHADVVRALLRNP